MAVLCSPGLQVLAGTKFGDVPGRESSSPETVTGTVWDSAGHPEGGLQPQRRNLLPFRPHGPAGPLRSRGPAAASKASGGPRGAVGGSREGQRRVAGSREPSHTPGGIPAPMLLQAPPFSKGFLKSAGENLRGPPDPDAANKPTHLLLAFHRDMFSKLGSFLTIPVSSGTPMPLSRPSLPLPAPRWTASRLTCPSA